MTRAKRLARIATISRRSERDAALSLAASGRELEASEHQLKEILAYREEYRAALRSDSSVPMSGEQAQQIRAFIVQVDTVVAALNEKIRLGRSKRDAARGNWVTTQQRANALDDVASREHKVEQGAQETQLQREIEDRGRPLSADN